MQQRRPYEAPRILLEAVEHPVEIWAATDESLPHDSIPEWVFGAVDSAFGFGAIDLKAMMLMRLVLERAATGIPRFDLRSLADRELDAVLGAATFGTRQSMVH